MAGFYGVLCTGQPARYESRPSPSGCRRLHLEHLEGWKEGIATMITVAKKCKAFRKARPGAVFLRGASQQGVGSPTVAKRDGCNSQ